MNLRNLLPLITFILCLIPLQAQTLLNEGFENGFPANGWTAIQEPTAGKHWETSNYNAIEGAYSLYIDEKKTSAVGDYDPQKEEYAITPAISLPADASYGVKFTWIAQSIGILDKNAYDFMVAVQIDGESQWNVIWKASDKKNIEESGIIFPWANWSRNVSTVSLEEYKGKTVKIAFIYKLIIPDLGNMVRMDNVSVIPHTSIKNPIVGGSTSYNFTDAYIGVKETSQSEELFLINKGIGELEVTGIEGLNGTDYSTNLVPGSIKLGPQQTSYFNVFYTPTETGVSNVPMTIKTNGGDLIVNLSGTKKALLPGYTIESFEGVDFYPTGWTGSGWALSSSSRSGDKAIYSVLANEATMVSPRLNMSSGTYSVTFDYAISFDDESDEYPENDFILEISKNGGKTWTQVWIDDVYLSNPYTRVTVDLGSPGSDDCRLRWIYEMSGAISFDRICNTIYLDNIVLPPMYGGKPHTASNPFPANGSINNFNNDLVLSWTGGLYAEGYKIYLGVDQNNPTSILNGVQVGKNVRSYPLSRLEYNTTYYWKVVPYNSEGEAEGVVTWSFKTMDDVSITTFPYLYEFEGDIFPPVGWVRNQENSRGWDRTNNKAYEGTYSGTVYTYADNGFATLQMPEIAVPADKDLQISFVWGNAVPANLSKSAQAPTVQGGDSIYFEIKTATTPWTVLAFCSQESGNFVWEKQIIVLSDYKGQRINLRWRYNATNRMKAQSASLDNIEIKYIQDIGEPVIYFKEWYAGSIEKRSEYNAGIVNYKQLKNSGEIFTLTNEGQVNLKIKNLNFNSDFFASTLSAGTEINPGQKITFGIVFTGIREQMEIKDSLNIEFEDGQIYKFPIKGSAMGESSYCYTFDDEEAFATQITDFKTIDQDGYGTVDFTGIHFPGKGSAFAFKIMNWEEADWRNLFPRSGQQMLMAVSPDDPATTPTKKSEDWLISKQLSPKTNAQLRFYAKSYGSQPDWNHHRITVLVSTTDNNIGSFTAVPTFNDVEIPRDPDNAIFKECIVDLSEYQGQKIYVAIKHTVVGGLAMFIDDIYFENFQFDPINPQAPIFVTQPTTTGEIGKEYTYDFTVADPDGNNITITVRSKPVWMTFTSKTNGGILKGTPTEAGEYYIKIIASNGTDETVQEYDLRVTPNSIGENSIKDVYAYPNPVVNTIFIAGEYSGTITLTNLAGEVVYTGNEVYEIPVNNLPTGIYVIKIKTEKGNYTSKIVKK